MSLKAYLLPLYKKYQYVKYFLKYRRPVGLSKTIWCFTHGFFTKNYILYDLDKNDPKLYVSDFRENMKIGLINKYTEPINNKLIFTELLSSVVSMPDVKGMIEAGSFVKYGKNSCGSFLELIDYMKAGKGMILKPIDGDGGEGIFLCRYENGSIVWNQQAITGDEFLNRLGKLNYYFISDLVEQHAYSQAIYSKSVNTIRIITMKDPSTGQPFIAVAAHRIGNDHSSPVDNCAKGGFTAAINLETGTLGKAVKTYFEGATPQWYTHHPDSGAAIEGVQVPHWDLVKSNILELARNFSFLEYTGWDTVLLPNGNITVLEANDGADLKLHQVHEPLLKDQRIKNFYSFHKAI